MGNAIRAQAEAALAAAHRLNADFLDIGHSLKRSRHDLWREFAGDRVHAPEVVRLPVVIRVDPVIAEFGGLDCP